MEEKKYIVFSDDEGKLYIDVGGTPYFNSSIDRHVPLKQIVDTWNWKVGESVSDKDWTFALTGSCSHIKRVL